VATQAGSDDVRVAHHGSAAMVDDDALGIAGRAGRVVEADRLPLAFRHAPSERRVALGDEGLVVEGAEPGAGLRVLQIVIIDDEWADLGEGQRLLHYGRELAVGDQNPGVGVIELEGHDGGIQPGVHRVKDGTGHGHAVVGFEHRRHVGEHHRHGVAGADAALCQCGGKPPAAIVEGAVVESLMAVDDSRVARPDVSCARDQRKGCQRLVVGGVGRKVFVEGIHELARQKREKDHVWQRPGRRYDGALQRARPCPSQRLSRQRVLDGQSIWLHIAVV